MIDLTPISEEINSRSLVDWATDHRGVVIKKRSQNYILAFCPFHKDGNNANLYFFGPNNQSFKCHSCGTGGHGIISFEMTLTQRNKKDFPETIFDIAKALNIHVPKTNGYVPKDITPPKRKHEIPVWRSDVRIGLPSNERNYLLTQEWARSTLVHSHRKELIARGLSLDAIKDRGFVSISKNMICPISNFEGQKIGFQLKPNDPTHGKYIWGNSEVGDGWKFKYFSFGDRTELPLNYVGNKDWSYETVFITEGILKGTITAYKFQVPVISCGGNNHASYPNQLKSYLKKSIEKGTTRVVICPDGGFNDGVFKSYKKTHDLIQSFDLGIEVLVCWWGQQTKTHKDIDELMSLANVQYLTWDEFSQINDLMCATKFTPDITISGVNYLNAEILTTELIAAGYNPQDVSLCIKSPLGSNKTGTALAFIEQFHSEKRLIANTPINTLGMQLIARYDEIVKVSNRPHKNQMLHLHVDDVIADCLLGDVSQPVVCCINSNHHWNKVSYLGDTVFFFDEVTAGLNALHEGGTFKNQGSQIACADATRRIIEECAIAIFTDGNLNDHSVGAIQAMAKGKTFVKVLVTGGDKLKPSIKVVPKKELVFNGFLGDCFEENLKRQGGNASNNKFAFTTDNQAQARIIYKLLKNQGLKEDQILIVDSERKNHECPLEFLQSPSRFLTETSTGKNIIALIYTPSMKTGYDLTHSKKTDDGGDWIDIPLFVRQYCSFQGILDIESCEQQMFRVRSPHTERIIHIGNLIQNPKGKKIDNIDWLARVGSRLADFLLSMSIETAQLTSALDLRHFIEIDPLFAYEMSQKEFAVFNSNIESGFTALLRSKGFSVNFFSTFISFNEDIQAVESVKNNVKAVKEAIQKDKEAVKEEVTQELAEVVLSITSEPLIGSSRTEIAEELRERGFSNLTATTYANVTAKLPNIQKSQNFKSPEIILAMADPDINLLQGLQRFLFVINGITTTAQDLATVKAMSDYWCRHGSIFAPNLYSESRLLKGLYELKLHEFILTELTSTPFHFSDPRIIEILGRSQREPVVSLIGVRASQSNHYSTTFNQLIKSLGLKTVFVKNDGKKRWFVVVPSFYPSKEYKKDLVEQSWALLDDILKSMGSIISRHQQQVSSLPPLSEYFKEEDRQASLAIQADKLADINKKSQLVRDSKVIVDDLSSFLEQAYGYVVSGEMTENEAESLMNIVSSYSISAIASTLKSIHNKNKKCWSFWKKFLKNLVSTEFFETT